MLFHGINTEIKNIPVLDPEFTPILRFNQEFLKGAKKPVSIAVERADGQMASSSRFPRCHPLSPR